MQEDIQKTLQKAIRCGTQDMGFARYECLLLLGTSLTQLLTQYSWAKYILFANTDLTQHIEGRPFFEDMTLSFSLILLLVYFVIFNALSWGIFKKRDVAA